MIQLFVLTILFAGSSGNDVVLGVVGKSAFIECKLPVSNMLAWEAKDGFIIAVDGKVTNENSTKYVIEDHGTIRESLVVRDLTLDDETSYRCFYLNNSTMNDVTRLNILASPTRMNLTSPQYELIEGTTVNFTCEADGGKPLPVIDWYITYTDGRVTEIPGIVEDTTYANGTGYRVNTLSLNITRDLFHASISCNISVSVLFTKTFTADTSILLAPGQPLISGYNGSFDENTPKSFECITNGSLPTASIYWLLDGRRLGDVEVVVVPEVNGTFSVISQFSRRMSRDYNGSVLTCAVTNAALEYRRLPPLMTNITLLAAYKPDVTRVQKEYMVEESDNVTLSCYIHGNPLPKFDDMYWTHEDTVIDRKYYKLSNESDVFSLVLNNIETFNAGNFSCHATNRLGTASSESIQLQVLYLPRCRSSTVENYAVWMGKSVRLNCNMEAVPNNVLFTWRYEITEEIILANQSQTNLTENNTISGSLELFVRSQSQYKTVVCYGRNSIGLSTKPCRYNIVPPGPPEAPSNCSTQTIDTFVSIKCNTGFNGGSKQHFVLQKFVNSMYETIQQTDEPMFNFVTYQNTTVRICAYNDDYSLTQICAAPIFVTVDIADLPQNEQQQGDNSKKTAYITGGVVAALGIIIVIIIVALLLRKYKKDLFIRSENNETRNQTSKKYMLKEWWKQTISRKFFTRESEPTISSINPSIRTGETVVDIETNDIPYQDIVTLANEPKHIHTFNYLVSTPRQESNIHRKLSTSNGVTIHSKFDATDDACVKIEQIDEAPNVLSESTGMVLSPIHKESPIGHTNDFVETHSTLATINYDKIGEGISKSYDTNDMLEGLCTLQSSVNENCGLTYQETKTHTRTLDQDYTFGDIDDALDQISKKTDSDASNSKSAEINVVGHSYNSPSDKGKQSGTEKRSSKITTLRDDTAASTSGSCKSNSCNRSEICSMSLTQEFNSAVQDISNDSATVLQFGKSNDEVSASMINKLSMNCENSFDEIKVHEPLQKSLGESKVILKKANSLPYRFNIRRQKVLKKTNSTTVLSKGLRQQSSGSKTLENKNLCDSDIDIQDKVTENKLDFSDQNVAPNHSIPMNSSNVSELSMLPEQLICSGSELTKSSVNDSYDLKEMKHFKPKEMSSPTDMSKVMYDINEYTLTINESVDDHTRSHLNYTTDKSFVTDSSLQDVDVFTLTVTSEQSELKDAVCTLDDVQHSTPQQQELTSNSKSLDDSVVYEHMTPRVNDIRRSGSFLEAMNNSKAFESDYVNINLTYPDRSGNSLSNKDFECSYYNHGFENNDENIVAYENTVKKVTKATEQNVDDSDSTLNDSTNSDFYI